MPVRKITLTMRAIDPVTKRVTRMLNRKPKIGDKKMIKGVLHERCFKMAKDLNGRVIGYDCTGGRQRYEWRPVEEVTTHEIPKT